MSYRQLNGEAAANAPRAVKLPRIVDTDSDSGWSEWTPISSSDDEGEEEDDDNF